LCSGFNTPLDEQNGAAMGIQAYIPKPFLKEQLARTIKAVLDQNARVKVKKNI
jgi:DNA-binding response OmpR family regulator